MGLLLPFNNFLLSRSSAYSSAESALQAHQPKYNMHAGTADRRLPSSFICTLERDTDTAGQADSALRKPKCHYGVGTARLSFLLITFGPCALFRAALEFLLPHLPHRLEMRISQ